MPTDKLDRWRYRKDALGALIAAQDADLVGLQEARHQQIRDIIEHLPGYDWFGVSRQGQGIDDEHCPVIYRKDRLLVEDSGNFWLSATPGRPASKSWRSALPRIVTWGLFRERTSAARFAYLNTHYDHFSWTARARSSELVVKKLGEIADGLPAVLTGDLNSKWWSKAYRILSRVMDDARRESEKRPEGPLGTYRSFKITSRPGARIDYVFVTPGVAVKSYRVVDDTFNGDRRPSDHMPLLVDFELP